MNRTVHSDTSATTSATRPGKAGFTLVELLVVIGIIALLISILLPTLSRARESANKVVCASNLRQLGLGMVSYTTDNQGIFPGGARADRAGFTPEDWIYWKRGILERDDGSNTIDPVTRRPIPNRDEGRLVKYMGGEFVPASYTCPSDDITAHGSVDLRYGKYNYSYTMNFWLDSLGDYTAQLGQAKVKLVDLKDSSHKVMMMEEGNQTINDGISVTATLFPRMVAHSPGGDLGRDNKLKDWLSVRHDRNVSFPDYTPTQKDIDAVANANIAVPNMNKGGNVAFADGHVEFTLRERVHGLQSRWWNPLEAD